MSPLPAEVDGVCVFCAPDRALLAQNALAIAFYDRNPVSPGHALVVPRRHVRTLFDTTPEEYRACFDLARDVHAILRDAHAPDGFNLGANFEAAGGQSVWHAHIHLIPRYRGDVEDPLGGVRHVIPRRPPGGISP
ncbi:MAG: HIT family protein [Gammaproteobacteria bacterium]